MSEKGSMFESKELPFDPVPDISHVLFPSKAFDFRKSQPEYPELPGVAGTFTKRRKRSTNLSGAFIVNL